MGARLHVEPNDVADGQISASDMHGHEGFVPLANISRCYNARSCLRGIRDSSNLRLA